MSPSDTQGQWIQVPIPHDRQDYLGDYREWCEGASDGRLVSELRALGMYGPCSSHEKALAEILRKELKLRDNDEVPL